MASLITAADGVRLIQFQDGTVRPTVRLGRVDKKAAAAVLVHVERLILTKQHRQPLPNETAAWLNSIGDKLHGRLVRAKLTEPRAVAATFTLGELIDLFIAARRGGVEPATLAVWNRARDLLCGRFGKATSADAITPADADDFRRGMRADGYAVATVSKMTQAAKAFFRYAVRRNRLAASPFDGIANGSQRNPDTQRYIDPATVQKAIDAAPDAEWRLLIALARYGGLRVPSEAVALRWADVNWAENVMTVRSPKTKHHPGGASRITPIFAELRPWLLEAFERADPGQEYVVGRWRTSAVNLRTQFQRILSRAGVAPWPKLWQNLRASRATELADRFPSHVAAAWLGHAEKVADRHYRQVTAAHVAAAASGRSTDVYEAVVPREKKPVQKSMQYPAAMARNDPKDTPSGEPKTHLLPMVAAGCGSLQGEEWAIQDSNL